MEFELFKHLLSKKPDLGIKLRIHLPTLKWNARHCFASVGCSVDEMRVRVPNEPGHNYLHADDNYGVCDSRCEF